MQLSRVSSTDDDDDDGENSALSRSRSVAAVLKFESMVLTKAFKAA